MDSLGSSMCIVVLPVNRNNLTSSFPIRSLLIFFPYLTAIYVLFLKGAGKVEQG